MLYSINNIRNHTFAKEAEKLQGMRLQILPNTVQVDRYLSKLSLIANTFDLAILDYNLNYGLMHIMI